MKGSTQFAPPAFPPVVGSIEQQHKKACVLSVYVCACEDFVYRIDNNTHSTQKDWSDSIVRHENAPSDTKCTTQYTSVDIAIIKHPLLPFLFSILFERSVLKKPYMN